MEIKRILVPMDFSPQADAALQYAASLAAKLDARVLVVNALQEQELENRARAHVPRRPVDLLFEDVDLELRARYRTAVPEQVRRFLRAELLVTLGDAAAEIVRMAENRGVDMIVMGTHGRTGLAHVFLGSVAEKVVRTARVPVLVVKESVRAVAAVA